ncbi:MAG: hypothetical protein J2O48_09360 [Solirubrobacterales bacterium]|nr:hypothetical protein [Solirubrobacterales bacterium]
MRKVISAVTRGHFFYSSWYRTEGRQDPEANDRGHTHIRSERREIHALVLASGQLAALIATEEGDVWHFLLATLEVAAEQLAAAVFAPAVSDTPDTFMSGWMAAWPAPGGSGEVNQEDLEMNGLGARSDVVRVTVDRNFGDPRSEVIENADMETLTGIYLNSFRQAAADVLQAA